MYVSTQATTCTHDLQPKLFAKDGDGPATTQLHFVRTQSFIAPAIAKGLWSTRRLHQHARVELLD